MIGHLAHFFQRRNTILVLQAGAVLLLISSVLTWVSVGGGQSAVSLSGAEMTTLVRTIGVIGVIGGVLITMARRWVRGALAAVLLGGGLIALAAAVVAMLDPAQAAAPALSRLGADGDVHTLGVGLWAGLAGSVVLISGALAVLLFSPGWDDESEGGA
ncbi:Trp biosynthesis-associated membrane protein [Garicola koreensis]|uniref:Putative membrane protein (TIGR02234 family) n=1 Tax=Garicola koreensis TaxID=1262554 RepID=A0A7W5TU60_9MICC|nr:Trp biosynthesis-associated membrane protein [Garicola koreensis]MBB3667364.1 putative membrane protein (TIGR02234 family) [Garicola koreensis]